jgi:ABC-type bacteriocin/lantibiotic exporter with double-glycine peptidase domain
MISPHWRYYASKYRGQFWPIAATCALSALEFLFVIPSVLLVRLVFDQAIPHTNYHLLLLAGAGIVLLNLAAGGLGLLVRRIALLLTKRVICVLRSDLLLKMYSISRRFFTESETSLLHSHIVHDSERVDVMTNSILSEMLPAVVCVLAVSVVLLRLNWKLYLVLFCTVPVFFLLNRSLSRRVKHRVQQFHRSFQGFSQGVLFLLGTIDLVRIQNAQEIEFVRQQKRLDELRHVSGEMAWLQSAFDVSQQSMTSLLLALSLVVGGWAVAIHAMTLGSLISFYFSLSLLNSYLRRILSSLPEIVAGNESLQVLYDLLVVDDVEPYHGLQRIAFQGNITFEQVRFGYRDADFLTGVDMSFPAGARIALIGPNGSGKTTLLHLLCGFYRPRQGRLLADGHPYDEIDIACLRESIGVVMQEPVLFSGSVFENLAYGSPDATLDEVKWAAEMATAHEFISKLPNGYDTLIGEDGTLISGGQRQRIAIARAILRRPRVLLLDEPTNHLDVDSVAKVTANLHRLPDAPTLIVVSHDINVVRGFDAIYEIRNGQAIRSQGIEKRTTADNASR